jgi:hypothetical protein
MGSLVCSGQPEGIAFAFRTSVCNHSRDRKREMLHVAASTAFPAQRSQFAFARENC